MLEQLQRWREMLDSQSTYFGNTEDAAFFLPMPESILQRGYDLAVAFAALKC